MMYVGVERRRGWSVGVLHGGAIESRLAIG